MFPLFPSRTSAGLLSTPQAPRMKGIPLPPVDTPIPSMPRPSSYGLPPHKQARTATTAAAKPLHQSSHRPHRPQPPDDGYTTAPEPAYPTSERHRRGSDPPIAPPSTSAAASPAKPRLKGILKSSKAARQQQQQQQQQPPVHRPASVPPPCDPPRPVRRIERKDDWALHWQLLPHEPNGDKPFLYFDIAYPPSRVLHCDARGWRPLTPADRAKLACKTSLDNMTLVVRDLPDFRVEAYRAGGVQVGDVLDAIHDTFSHILTHTDRHRLAGRVEMVRPWFEHRRARAPDDKMRRFDLLAGRTLFGGVEWIEPCTEHPDGAYVVLLERAPPAPPSAPLPWHGRH
ncbi:hypothetical protein K488DRAFT_70112 [Vararia minispora EC-137]|uniref:Uncharacterized protein n=1 Tax=Vararia minispora EC-137 TaxID=1314806 RepID=A0ACB8QMP5_9AGAM|nr:hypothetical protein K488DRAFT_70112 [Vararia minispora EC-137]